MDDEIWDKAWSSIQPGDQVRWATPTFIKFGRVLNTAGRSATFVWDDGKQQAVPDARWYFVEGKRDPMPDEHLVVIQRPTDDVMWLAQHRPVAIVEQGWCSTHDAAEMLNWDEKKLRRYIRRGHILARKHEDRWEVNREALRDKAAKQGWV